MLKLLSRSGTCGVLIDATALKKIHENPTPLWLIRVRVLITCICCTDSVAPGDGMFGYHVTY